ncbi:hypothetical protein ZWY2020_040120 [Hordeum vulgare]|nr:hypothetical protein ZWY2020_040120 [Hordeum vulgare]
MEPLLREPGLFPPEYITSGEESLLFSVEFEHNGIFIGEGMNRSYLLTIATFDHCHADTWSLSMVKYCLDRLDYSHGFPDLQVYWCLPDKDIVDGLVCVNSEEVIAAMINASKEAKTLLVIVDEENKIRRFYEDVIKDGPPLPDDIVTQNNNHRLDPVNDRSSMVYTMGEERRQEQVPMQEEQRKKQEEVEEQEQEELQVEGLEQEQDQELEQKLKLELEQLLELELEHKQQLELEQLLELELEHKQQLELEQLLEEELKEGEEWKIILCGS